MPWVEFTDDYDWRPAKHAIIAFKKGMRMLVTREAAEKAIAAGKAEPIERPTKNGTEIFS